MHAPMPSDGIEDLEQEPTPQLLVSAVGLSCWSLARNECQAIAGRRAAIQLLVSAVGLSCWSQLLPYPWGWVDCPDCPLFWPLLLRLGDVGAKTW